MYKFSKLNCRFFLSEHLTLRNITLCLTSITVLAFLACSSDSNDENRDVKAVYYGTLNIISSGYSHISPNSYIPTGFEEIPYEIKTLKDTLEYYGRPLNTSQHCFFTLTEKKSSSILDIVESYDGDSIFYWYTKELIIYKEGKYTPQNSIYEFEVTANGIYFNYVGAEDGSKRLYKKLTDYGEIRYTKTDKSENRPVKDVTLKLSCSDNSLQYEDGERKYKATINDTVCVLYQLSPDKYEIKMHKIK